MNTPKPPRPKRVRLRIPEGGTVIFDFEEQAAIWLRSGYPQVAIDRLRNGASIESAELRAAIADFMEGNIKRKPGRPLRDPIEDGIREADALKAELVRSTVLVREQEMAKLRRKQPKLRRKLTGGAVPTGSAPEVRQKIWIFCLCATAHALAPCASSLTDGVLCDAQSDSVSH